MSAGSHLWRACDPVDLRLDADEMPPEDELIELATTSDGEELLARH